MDKSGIVTGTISGKRFVTITFDDGLIEGARTAAEILDAFGLKATFYLVTGWVRPRQFPFIRDPWNRGRDHGSWSDWRVLQNRGHDIGSHTFSHLNASGRVLRNSPTLIGWELSHSFAQLRHNLGRAPSSISMPWNTTSDIQSNLSRLYRACRLGSEIFETNDLAGISWHQLHSWAPRREASAEEITNRIRTTPNGHWLILQFHSLDGEGYMPFPSDTFRSIVKGIAETPNLETLTVDEMVERFGKRRICIITSEHLAANPRVVKEADALSEAGNDVRVVACQWMDWAQREDARLRVSRKWRCEIIDYSRESDPELFWRSRFRHYIARQIARLAPLRRFVTKSAVGRVGPELIERAASEPADLFIGHNLTGLPVAVIVARRQGAEAGFDAEDFHSGMWLYETGPSVMDRLAALIEKRFLPDCTHLTAASPLIAAAYAREYSIEIPPTILNVFPLSDRPRKFRSTDAESPLTLYWFSQTIGARRGLEEIVYAIGISGSKHIELHLRGTWQAGYEEKLRSVAREAGLHDSQLVWHEFAPPEEMVRLATEFDIGLALEQPISENRDICLTNKIFTYLLGGNAIIATATHGQREVMDTIPGVGLCYEPGNVDRVAETLRVWRNDRASLEMARRKAWQYGEEKYNWEIEKQKLFQAFDKAGIQNSSSFEGERTCVLSW